MMSLPIDHRVPSTSFSNHASGPLNAHTGQGSQYNNNAGGPQYIAHGTQIINAGFSRGNDLVLQDERQACLYSLSFRYMGARQDGIAPAHYQTCDWLFETQPFQCWRNRCHLEQHNGVLWIKGHPGTGKSTLMKHMLEYFQRNSSGYTTVSHFFNARGDPSEKTALGMLRSLIYQLITSEPAIYERFIPIFREKQQMYRQGEWDWREPELKRFLRDEIKRRQSDPLVVLVDALDECRHEDSLAHVRDVVGFLEELSIDSIRAKAALYICLSSRHYPHISMAKCRELVVEKMEGHDKDIAKYICDKLTKRDADIEESMLGKASGIFMWVVLVVTMLNRAYDEGKVEAMHRKLRDVPGDLDEMFKMLLGTDNPDKHETVLMLQWVLFARRPLESEELYFAMLAGTCPDDLGAWDQSLITRDDIRRRITNSSKGLIEIRNDRYAQFIHESVNDFLLRNQRLQALDPTLEANPIGNSHDRLKHCCVTYITSGALALWDTLTFTRDTWTPFLRYAIKNLLYHIEAAEERGVDQAGFLRWLRYDYSVLKWLWLFYRANESYFAEHGICRILAHYPDFFGDSDSTYDGGNDLVYMSAADRCSNLVRLLLKDGAGANMPCENGAILEEQNARFGTALQAATYWANGDIVKLLLEHGAEVNVQGSYYGTALQAAAANRHEGIVKLLLENGTEVNVQGGHHGTALQAAAVNNHEGIVKLLLEHGAEVNARGGHYSTALQAAAVNNHEGIVKLLLEHGAEVNARGGYYGTALSAAAGHSHKGIVKLLLEHGADVNARDRRYGSALQAAAKAKNKNIVNMLLEKGALS